MWGLEESQASEYKFPSASQMDSAWSQGVEISPDPHPTHTSPPDLLALGKSLEDVKRGGPEPSAKLPLLSRARSYGSDANSTKAWLGELTWKACSSQEYDSPVWPRWWKGQRYVTTLGKVMLVSFSILFPFPLWKTKMRYFGTGMGRGY